MKKTVVFLLSFILVTAVFAVDSADSSEVNRIIVDPRTELLCVLLHLTELPETAGLNQYSFPYRQEMREYFQEFSMHPAVLSLKRLMQSGFNMDAPMSFVLYHNYPDFTQRAEYTQSLKRRAGGEEILFQWAVQISDFIQKSRFDEFYISHSEYFETLVENAHAAIGGAFSYQQVLESFYGETKHELTVILSPLLKGGGYGPQILYQGKKEIYCIMGPQSDAVIQHRQMGNRMWFMYLPFHEFSHSFVNPVTEKHREELQDSEILFTSLSDTMRNQAYTSWETCVNEHLVRVNVIRIISDVMGMGGYMLENVLLNQEKNRGFIYIGELNSLTRKYEENRSLYPAYSDFYTEILAFFNEKACSLQAAKE